MSTDTELNIKRTLEEANGNCNNPIQPPLKKQKQFTTNTNDSSNSYDINSKNALLLLPGTVTQQQLHDICLALTDNGYQVMEPKSTATNDDQLEHLFIECDESSINIVDLVSNGIFEAFSASNTLWSVLVLDNGSLYTELRSFSKAYIKQNVYFTLNYDDYMYKYKIVFSTKVKHNIFWGKSKTKCVSQVNKTQLNSFYDETQKELEIERSVRYTKCCCIPVSLCLNQEYSKEYREIVKKDGMNKRSRKWYQQSIERSSNIYSGSDHYISIESGIMDQIWGFLGVVIGGGKDKVNIKSYQCRHCGLSIALKVPINVMIKPKVLKVKKKKTNQEADKHCDICNADVPNNEKNWQQHVNGKKHIKKAKNAKVQ